MPVIHICGAKRTDAGVDAVLDYRLWDEQAAVSEKASTHVEIGIFIDQKEV